MPRPNTPERIASEPEVVRQFCISALRSLGEYAPEIEPGDAQILHADLTQLSQTIATNFSGAESRRVQEGVRAALQTYRQQAQTRLGRMRKKVEVAQTTIREFADGISAGNATHHGGVQQELENLNAMAETGDLPRIRRALGQACAGIRSSHAAFVRAQQMAMLQLQDEIRILRDTIELHQRERERDPQSGAWKREYLDAEIRARLARKEAFSVLLLSIHNLGRLQAEHSPEAILGLFDAFQKRLAAIAGNIGSNAGSNDLMIARWSPSAFALLLPAAGPRADAIRDLVCGRLPGAYAVQTSGISCTLVLDLSITMLDPAVEFAAHQ